MKITFPHMGQLSIVAKSLISTLGQNVVVPPPCSKKTLLLGVKHSPESACLPFKINIGNFIEAAEMGADTIIMTGGCGPCRFGYYGEVQRQILRDLGYQYDVFVLEKNEEGFKDLKDNIKFLTKGKSYFEIAKAMRLAWSKAKAIDEVEITVQRMRASERVFGTCDKLFQRACKRIDKASNVREVDTAAAVSKQEICNIHKNKLSSTIRIAIVGEIYTILEPFANLNIEKHLGRLGAETVRSLYLSQWINDHLFGGLLSSNSARTYVKKAKPYLPHCIGGHAVETLGSALHFAEEGYDGFIQVAPLTCMPEIVVQSMLPYFAAQHDIPFMTLYLDEQSGEAGLVTRLEAFCDLIRQRKKAYQKESV